VKKDIIITNNKSETIDICVFQQLPFSKEESIKVKLIVPDLTEEHISKDEFSIIQWKYRIVSGDKETVKLEYTIESQPDHQIDFKEQTGFEKTSY